MITGSKKLIRDINSHLVLETIIREKAISRADIAKELGLTKATISAIVQELLDRQWIMEIGNGDTVSGRKPILLSFNPACGQVLSIDLGLHFVTAMLSDLRGANCRLKQYPNTASGKDILDLLIAIIEEFLSLAAPTVYGITGISLAIHGTVYENEITFAPYYPYQNIPLKALLEERFSIPVYLENEANLSVIGEHTFHYHAPHVIGISVHSGVGIGIILNSSLYKGFNGNAGEFGHTIVVDGGRPCPCGNCGCLEQYVSERSILDELARRKQLPETDIDTLIALYRRDDPDARELVAQFIHYMAIGINNLLNIFNPERIIINSSFTIYLPEVLKKIQERLKNRMSAYGLLVTSGLQDTSILLGGACVCIQNFLEIEHLDLTE